MFYIYKQTDKKIPEINKEDLELLCVDFAARETNPEIKHAIIHYKPFANGDVRRELLKTLKRKNETEENNLSFLSCKNLSNNLVCENPKLLKEIFNQKITKQDIELHSDKINKIIENHAIECERNGITLYKVDNGIVKNAATNEIEKINVKDLDFKNMTKNDFLNFEDDFYYYDREYDCIKTTPKRRIKTAIAEPNTEDYKNEQEMNELMFTDSDLLSLEKGKKVIPVIIDADTKEVIATIEHSRKKGTGFILEDTNEYSFSELTTIKELLDVDFENMSGIKNQISIINKFTNHYSDFSISKCKQKTTLGSQKIEVETFKIEMEYSQENKQLFSERHRESGYNIVYYTQISDGLKTTHSGFFGDCNQFETQILGDKYNSDSTLSTNIVNRITKAAKKKGFEDIIEDPSFDFEEVKPTKKKKQNRRRIS